MIKLLKSKIHRAQVTGADVDYEGSILVDRQLLQLAGIFQYEQVDVWNVTNGNRFTTYALESEETGQFLVNGAAARLVSPGDIIIVACWCYIMDTHDALNHKATKLIMGSNNSLKEYITE